jgi:Putative 2OG-Fe(II) oxygenase
MRDPRAPGVAMYAPHLAFALPGGLSVGMKETVRPKADRLVMFPAWLLHQVRPYRGSARCIFITFDLRL